MDITPRNSFNCQLAQRYLEIPTAIPQATYLNIPIGTRFCDTVGFMCHPQTYQNFHEPNETYPNVRVETSMYNLDYYNPLDNPAKDDPCNLRVQPDPSLDHFFENHNQCHETPKLWRNSSKLYKFNQA